MADKKSGKKLPLPQKIVYIFLVLFLFLTIAEGAGYNPVGWLRDRINSFFAPDCNDNLVVSFIDVGQGDCVLISCGGQNMLIDCGESTEFDRVAAFLNSQGVKRIDVLAATHPHSDHMGCMGDVVSNYDIGEIIMPHIDDSDIPTTRYYERFIDACSAKGLYINEAQLGSTIKIGEAEAEIIAPNSLKYSGANNYSMGIILRHGSNSFLFTGDAEKLAEEEMLQSGRLQHVKVYKAGHHGSDTSSSEDFLKVVSPDYAVIMCGEGNSYGHPSPVIVDRLSEYARKIYRTDQCGSIIFESDGSTLQIRTERGIE